MMKLSLGVFVVSVVLLVSGGAFGATKKDAPAPQGPAAQTSQADDSLSGKVVETMDAGGYTYVSLEKNGKRTWVAMPQTKVKVGQKLTCQPGAVMNDFTSKTLNRTFETIVFSQGIQ
jgi:hypothetical protein